MDLSNFEQPYFRRCTSFNMYMYFCCFYTLKIWRCRMGHLNRVFPVCMKLTNLKKKQNKKNMKPDSPETDDCCKNVRLKDPLGILELHVKKFVKDKDCCTAQI